MYNNYIQFSQKLNIKEAHNMSIRERLLELSAQRAYKKKPIDDKKLRRLSIYCALSIFLSYFIAYVVIIWVAVKIS